MIKLVAQKLGKWGLWWSQDQSATKLTSSSYDYSNFVATLRNGYSTSF